MANQTQILNVSDEMKLNDNVQMKNVKEQEENMYSSSSDTLKYVRMLKERNIDVYYEVEKIHSLKDGEFLLTILSSVAQQEVENTSAYVRKGIY